MLFLLCSSYFSCRLIELFANPTCYENTWLYSLYILQNINKLKEISAARLTTLRPTAKTDEKDPFAWVNYVLRGQDEAQSGC